MEAFEKLEGNRSDGVVVVRPASETMSRQRLPYYIGISEATAGAKNISMNLIVIPPAGAAKPHLHKGYETAIYLLKGRVETRYGHNLERSIVSQEGDFILIKPDVPHQPVNLDPKDALGISLEKRAFLGISANHAGSTVKTFPEAAPRFLWQSFNCIVK